MSTVIQKIMEKREAPVVLPEMSNSSSVANCGNRENSIFSKGKTSKSLGDWLSIGGFFGGTASILAWNMQHESYTSKAWRVIKLHDDILAGSEKPMFKSICLGRMRKSPPSKKLLIATAIGITALVTGMIIKSGENKSTAMT